MGNGQPTRRITKVLVAAITFRRPESLRRMLESLHNMQADVAWRLVVVDNDAAQSARSIAKRAPIEVHYECEPKPGIAAARNRCLDLVAPDDNAIVFLDDDETVSSGWLQSLVDCAHAFDADVVGGPVLSILPESTPEWIRTSGFHQRRIRPTGTRTGLPATNNVLIRTKLLEDGLARFDDAFSLTGGSDTDFFMRLKEAGASIVWSADAKVSEPVPAERTDFVWIVRRFTRAGEVWARIRLRTTKPARIMVEALACCVVGLASAPIVAITLKSERRMSLALFCRGRGMLRALRGNYHREYARD